MQYLMAFVMIYFGYDLLQRHTLGAALAGLVCIIIGILDIIP